MPEKDEVIELFAKNCMMCLASGAVNRLFKFYFFAEMVRPVAVMWWGLFIRGRSRSDLLLSLSCCLAGADRAAVCV